MQVQDLINQLKQMNPDAEVYFTYNYGDYWKTTVAADIGEVAEGRVEHSDYHNMMKVVDEDAFNEKQIKIQEQCEEEGEEYVEEESPFVVLLTA